MLGAGVIILSAFCGFALGQGDPTMVINVKSITVENKPNSMLGEVSATINPGKPVNTADISVPIKAKIDDNTMIKVTLSLDGNPLPSYDMTVCEAMTNKYLGEDFVRAGKEFPKKCPLQSGNWKIVNWKPEGKNMPAGIPNGKFVADAEVYVKGSEPFLKLKIDGEVSRSVPGMG